MTGQLICRSDEENAAVVELLPRHIELTLAEPGCVSFAVEQSDDPWIWDVTECFKDARSYDLHQARVQASEWGHATADIERSYTISGL
nr:antibiotic biosynthesis monooxygenase [Brevibacterium zhoupengii]